MQEILLDKNQTSILKQYSNQKENFHIIPQWSSNTKLWIIIKNSEISFLFDIQNKDVTLECYFLIPPLKNQNVKLNIQTNIKASNTNIVINLIALSNDESFITLDGNLHIDKDTHNIQSRLYEETLLIWNAQYISLIPWLKVDSPDVIASHWAKIQRISPERLFYMQSRWLSVNKAINMIINSYSQQIIEKLQLDKKMESEFYSMLD